MIYTDGIHIISDAGVQELHWFAERVGIGRWWFEAGCGKCGNHPHYDKPKRLPLYKLFAKGAHLVSSKQIVQIIKNQPSKNKAG